MKNLVIRKRVAYFSNWQFDDFMQRAVKASGSLKNNAFSKYVSDFDKSVKEFQECRKATTSSSYTLEIRKTASQADEIFRKIKMAVDYTSLCLTGQEQGFADILSLLDITLEPAAAATAYNAGPNAFDSFNS